MRLLFASLLLFCFQSFVVCTAKDGTLTFGQKVINRTSLGKATDSNISKNNQLDSKQNLLVVNLSGVNLAPVVKVTVLALFSNYCPSAALNLAEVSSKAGTKINFSYQFIFDCLYPKHSFW